MRVVVLLFLVALPSFVPTSAAASPAAPSSCSVTPVHHALYHGLAGMPEDVPWIVARPRSAHIIGFLFFAPPGAAGRGAWMHTNGNGPNGGTDKILWYATKGETTGTLTITGKNESSPGVIRQVFRIAGGGGGYPSILDMPTAGCWHVTVRTGRVTGHVTLEVLQ